MKKIFDDFTFSAEVLPTIIVVLPLILIGIYHGALSGEWKQTSIEFITAAAVLCFLAKIAKNLGKSYQNKMYADLNGMPTTIVMRFSDEKIDTLSKKKYHKWFNDKDEQYQLPMSLDEEQADLLSDSKYKNAMRDLRNYANSKRELYPRVYQELKNTITGETYMDVKHQRAYSM